MSQPAANIDPWGDKWMKVFWRRPAPDVGERTRRRVSLHLIPYLFFLYILAYLDRVNISAAEQSLRLPVDQGGLGLTTEITGFAAGIFFWGYWILEIPSTLSVEKRGARYVFIRILVLWGIMATVIGFVGLPVMQSVFGWLPTLPQGDTWLGKVGGYVNDLDTNPAYQLYLFRFLLGLFEGGFFPSVIVYLSHWFRGKDRAKAIAAFMAAIPLSNVIGYPISAVILKYVAWLGLEGWRWIFILEGIVPILAGFATLFFLPARPQSCTWLPEDEKQWLVGELQREHEQKQSGHGEIFKHLGVVTLLTIVYVCLNITSYGLGMFMPAIIKSQTNLSTIAATLVGALPYAMALVGMVFNGWHSDRSHERIFHVAAPLTMLSIGLALAAFFDAAHPWPAVIMILCVGTFLYAHLPAYWPIPTMFMGAATAAAAIGFINMIGNLGGFIGPTLVGGAAARAKETGSFAGGLWLLAPWPLAAAVIILLMKLFIPRQDQASKS